jgi:hypothetical protein
LGSLRAFSIRRATWICSEEEAMKILGFSGMVFWRNRKESGSGLDHEHLEAFLHRGDFLINPSIPRYPPD